jgi:hypothetical protein
MVLFDATTLLLLFAPDAGVPTDSSGAAITYPKARIDGLVMDLTKSKTKIVIPTPALSEMLVRAGAKAGPEYLAKIRKSVCFRIEAFDEKAAIEVALMTKAAIDKGDKKSGSDETWAKIKYDRQIVAVGKVHSVTAVYSDDGGVRSFGSAQGLRVIGIGELPIPDAAAQKDWVDELDEHPTEETAAPSQAE